MPSAEGSKGRFTPKKAKDGSAAAPDAKGDERLPGYRTSGRYTPPTVHTAEELHQTRPWVPYLMFALLGLGFLVIVLNYLELLPGASDTKYLIVGLLAITGGFATATQLR